MSIPLDRLYYYIENIAEEIYGSPVIIYRFFPHGSKKLEHLEPLKYRPWNETVQSLRIHCNDQEPLTFDFYKNYQPKFNDIHGDKYGNIIKTLPITHTRKHFKNEDIYDQSFVLHSEKRSKNLKTYQQNQHITVYYWAHALLAMDWFRYANYVCFKKESKKIFLVYNRAWTGTREYRLKFADLLIDNNLVDKCQISVGFTDNGIHYKQAEFIKPQWRPQHQLEQYFKLNNTSSDSSADFTIEDYENTAIEIVLETLFDDDRLHLTEKSLRPIACGQPFILAATHGSLEYLRSYGFKTFDGIIDESYDLIEDPLKRLQAIIYSMNQIAAWSKEEQHYKLMQMQQIADYNRQYFFSDEFFNIIKNELQSNLIDAYKQVEKSCGKHYIELLKQIKQYKLLGQMTARREVTCFVRQLRQSGQGDQSRCQTDPPV